MLHGAKHSTGVHWPHLRIFTLALAACTSCDGLPGHDSTACADTASVLPSSCACDVPTVEIGGGDIAFVEASDGMPATMVHGPQGGWHLLGSARMVNFAPIVTIHYTVTAVALGTVVSDNTYRVQMVAESDCTGFYPGMYGYLDVTDLASGEVDTPPEVLAGQQLVLRMDVTDTEGRLAEDELVVIAALDEADL